jgi:hypothetical protein
MKCDPFLRNVHHNVGTGMEGEPIKTRNWDADAGRNSPPLGESVKCILLTESPDHRSP